MSGGRDLHVDWDAAEYISPRYHPGKVSARERSRPIVGVYYVLERKATGRDITTANRKRSVSGVNGIVQTGPESMCGSSGGAFGEGNICERHIRGCQICVR